MLFLLGGRHLGLLWLCVPLLWLLETPLATSSGELCHFWHKNENRTRHFWCMKFCCGTCSAPHCCLSIRNRLDQEQCSAAQQVKQVTEAPKTGPDPALGLPGWAFILIVVIAAVALGSIVFCFHRVFHHICNRLRHRRASRNLNQHNIPIPDLRDSPEPGPSPTDGENHRVEDPQGSTRSSYTIDISAQSGRANVGYRDDESQRRPTGTSARAVRGRSPSRAHDSSSVRSRSDAGESQGTRPRTTTSVRHSHRRNRSSSRRQRSASVEARIRRRCNDPPPYDENWYVSQALTVPSTLANPQDQLEDDLSRCSSMDSNDPPAYHVLFPTSDASPVAQVGDAKGKEAQPGPSGRSDPALGTGGPSPSQASLSRQIPSRRTSASSGHGLPTYQDYESLGARPRTSLAGQGPTTYDRAAKSRRSKRKASSDGGLPSYDEACALVPSYIAQEPHDSKALAKPQAPLDSSLSASQGSAIAATEDPPSYFAAISQDRWRSPRALDCPAVEPIRPATPGPAEDEAITASPPDLLSAAGPI